MKTLLTSFFCGFLLINSASADDASQFNTQIQSQLKQLQTTQQQQTQQLNTQLQEQIKKVQADMQQQMQTLQTQLQNQIKNVQSQIQMLHSQVQQLAAQNQNKPIPTPPGK